MEALRDTTTNRTFTVSVPSADCSFFRSMTRRMGWTAKSVQNTTKQTPKRSSSKKAAKVYSKEDQEILDGFREAVLEWKKIKAGQAQTRPFDEAMAELRTELEVEGYEFD